MIDDFTRGILRIISARVAEENGFTSISETALDIFVDATVRRLSLVAGEAAAVSSHCGRTDTNAQDVFASLRRYGESADTLSVFVSRGHPFPPFEFLIDAYPIAKGESAKCEGEVLPFRANTTFSGGHIPPFFPSRPEFLGDKDGAEGFVPVNSDEYQEGLLRDVADLFDEGECSHHSIKFDSDISRLVMNDLLCVDPDKDTTSVFKNDGVIGRNDPEYDRDSGA